MERVLKVKGTSITGEIEPDSVYNMDVLELMKHMPDESVDLIIADPPYFEVYGDFDFIWDSEEELGMEETEEREQLGDVWDDRTEASQSSIERCVHPTVKSQGICQRLITVYSNEGDLVFVPFMGAGSEVASCIMNKRHFVGSEIDKYYFEKSIPRIEYLCLNKTMRKKWCTDPEMKIKILA